MNYTTLLLEDHGHITRYSVTDGAPPGGSTMVEDRQGAIWVGARRGLFRYADGKWLDTNQIPLDRTSWGSFAELTDRAEQQIRQITEALPKDAPEGSTQQKAGDFYRAYLDTETIERNGLTPARPGLEAIASARTHE